MGRDENFKRDRAIGWEGNLIPTKPVSAVIKGGIKWFAFATRVKGPGQKELANV